MNHLTIHSIFIVLCSATGETFSPITVSKILNAIETQSKDFKRLIQETKPSINTRLDALDTVLVNAQPKQLGVKKKVEKLELAMSGCDSCLVEVEKTCEELRFANNFLCDKLNDIFAFCK